MSGNREVCKGWCPLSICVCVYEGVIATNYTAGGTVVESEAGGKLQMRISEVC